MSEKPNGGPAFPWDGMGDDGMSLRDYFAAKALQGIMAHSGDGVNPGNVTSVTKVLYLIADAMLKERSK
jgi:hypothetical protein